MRKFSAVAQGFRFFEYSAKVSAVVLFTICVGSTGRAQTTDLIAPTPPTGLVANAASCGQVDLSWSASTDTGGSGLKAYIINRSDNVNTAIGATRTTFSDTNLVKSSTTLTYSVVAQDNAGNKSSPSNSVTLTTPACPMTAGESIIDGAYIEPLGKSMATYGARSALIYTKQNAADLTLDTWLYVNDRDTGQTSKFLLHRSPGYRQIETDYVLTSPTELWTLSFDPWGAGKVLVSQYGLNGSPVNSATLLSTKSLGDSGSFAKSMIRLQSGALMVAWNQDSSYKTDGSVDMGIAYLSANGNWTVQFPLTISTTDGGNNPRSQIAMAQHPADGSIWVFSKRDAFDDIIALHFTEAGGAVSLDWSKPDYIDALADGTNSPQGEFPFLAATADPTRNAILLAYQAQQSQFVFIDPLFNDMNAIALKAAYATVAQISADGSKLFVPFQTYMERDVQFGFSVLSDGTIWLAYQPINHQSLTWNEVYASQYSNGTWSAPAFVGYNYVNYNTNAADSARYPGFVVSRADQPQVSLLTPDQKVHSFTLSNLAPAPADTIAPTVSVTSPTNGANVTGNITLSASATDNMGVTKVDFLIDGSLVGSVTSSPYNLPWNSTAVTDGTHSLQSRGYDAAGNAGSSPSVAFTVSNQTPGTSSSLSVAITSPSNGGTVPRNQRVTIGAAAKDTVAVTKVEFYVNSSLLGTATTQPYNYPWKVPGKKGQYNIQAKAYDSAGRTAAQAITVTAQ
jgi:hypothetical protein